MNSKQRIFILLLVVITGSSAFLFAKGRLEKAARYVVYAKRGEVTALPHSPMQGRIVLTEVNSTVTYFPLRGEPTKIGTREFIADWPDFDPKASVTFQAYDEDTHLDLVLSKPYYDRARRLLSFDVRSKNTLIPYHEIYEVNFYIHE